MKIDVHNHYFPPAYIDDNESRPWVARLHWATDKGYRHLNYAGDYYHVIAEGHVSLDARTGEMDAAGVDSKG